jgi:hypothetical protein
MIVRSSRWKHFHQPCLQPAHLPQHRRPIRRDPDVAKPCLAERSLHCLPSRVLAATCTAPHTRFSLRTAALWITKSVSVPRTRSRRKERHLQARTTSHEEIVRFRLLDSEVYRQYISRKLKTPRHTT